MRGKRIIWIYFIGLLLTSLAMIETGTSPTTAILAIEPPTSTGSVGGSFTVDVNVYGVTDLFGYSVLLSFNKDVINVVDLDRGPFFEKVGYWTEWQLADLFGLPYGTLDNVGGFIIVGDNFATLPPTGVSGDGTLFSIDFDIVADGVSAIHFDEELTKLSTIIEGNVVPISCEMLSGVFDNRVENTLPIAMFTAPMSGVVGIPLTFTSTSYDPDGWIVSEEWDFGDGENATGTVVEHTFATAGIFTVTLTVTDGPDGDTASAPMDIDIAIWMEGGWIPDLIPYYAKPAHPDLDEAYGDRTLDILGKVGNPTEEDYEVYVEFKLYSKDEVNLLGNLNTPVYTIAPGEQRVLSAEFDTANPQWRCFSGGYWVIYGYVHWRMHKYIAFATCYSRLVGETEWTKGYVTNYLSWHVKSVPHNIGIVDMWTSTTSFPAGTPVDVSVNVTNTGAMSETFTVSIFYKNVTIEDIEVTLDPGEWQVLTTTWDTIGVDPGPYVVKSALPLLAYERDATDQEDYYVVHVTL